MTLLSDTYVYYKFEETSGTSANDETANNKDATISGVTFEATGKSNKCFYYNDAADYVVTPSLTSVKSLSFWFYVEDNTANRYYIYDARSSQANNFIYINPADRHLVFGSAIGTFYLNGSSVTSDSQTLTLDTWYHAVIIITTAFTGTLKLGGKYTGGECFNGRIDEVLISQASLASYVSDLYNSGNGFFYPFSTDVNFNASTFTLSTTETSPVYFIQPQSIGLSASLTLKVPTFYKTHPNLGTVTFSTGTIGTLSVRKDYWKIENTTYGAGEPDIPVPEE